MHPSVLAWVGDILAGHDILGRQILEAGSADVNGTVRPLLQPLAARYKGVDIAPGPGVDEICDVYQLCDRMGRAQWDIVIATELLEHVTDWRTAVTELAGAVKPGGLLLITTRSPGFPYHAFPEDHWRFTLTDMTAICGALGLHPIDLREDPEPTAPGVFLLARKPHRRATSITIGALEYINVATT